MKKDKRLPYKRRIFKTFLLSYLSILLLIVITGVALMYVAMTLTFRSEMDKNESMLRQAALTIDSNLSTIDGSMSSILFSDPLRTLSQHATPYEDPATVISAIGFKDYLASLHLNNILCQDLVIYLSRPNILFTSSGQNFFSVNDYFRGFVSVDGLDAESGAALFTSRYRRPFLAERSLTFGSYSNFGVGTVRCMLYVRPIIVNGSNLGNMIAILPKPAFSHILLDSAFSDGQAWIESKDGEILLSLPTYFSERPDDTGMLESAVTSGQFGLTYRVLTPRSGINDAFLRVGKLIAGIVAVILLVGLLLSFFLASHLGQPLDNLSSNLRVLFDTPSSSAERGIAGGLNEMKFIDATVQNLLVEQKLAEEYLNAKTGIVQQLFYEKLLLGYFPDEAQILSKLEEINEPVFQMPLCLIVCHLFSDADEISLSESAFAKNALDSLLTETVPRRHKLIDIRMEICAVICEGDCARDDPARLAQALGERLREMPHIACSLLVSPAIERYDDIGVHYSQCLELAQRPSCGSACELSFVSQLSSANRLRLGEFSLDDEGRLVNFILTGSQNNVQETLDRILAGADDGQSEFGASEKLLLSHLLFTLVRLQGRFRGEDYESFFDKLPAQIHRLNLTQTRAEAHAIVRDCYETICQLIQAGHGTKTQLLMRQIQAYIDENYADVSLSLKGLAECFGLSEAYLSRAFKSYVGINPMSYVEKTRIEHAISLLRANTTFENIALSVGFDNVDRFRNAFKRNTGKLPSQYREESISEELTRPDDDQAQGGTL